MTQARTVVLVHGAWHGAWCWAAVQEQLDAAGVPNVAVDNPSVAKAPASLTDDADNVLATIDALDGPVLLVGHSYGGAVITDAGTHPRVQELVYVSAFALDDGESCAQNELRGGEAVKLAEALTVDGELGLIDPARVVEFFFHDCTPETASAAAAQLAPMSMAALAGVPRSIAWRTKPSTFVLCTDDHAVPVALQKSIAARTSRTVEMATSHSPFLSRPAELAVLLAELSRQ